MRKLLVLVLLISVPEIWCKKKKKTPESGEKSHPDLGDVKGLRDSLDGLMQGLESLENLFGVVEEAGDLECGYVCKNGKKPRKNPQHVPRSNGCGSFGLQMDTTSLPAMTRCCDKHDICYDTCGKNRQDCDDKFKSCLDKMCENLSTTLSKDQYEGCQMTSQLMYAGTTSLGCKSFKDAQKRACICDEDNDWLEKPIKTSKTSGDL
ncbi:PREDICTED: group XIIA secretory phospholipase A2-like [Branchiostoma belcheri]|uniref:Group XIIA secretory phospholipase A2-like n=1 Tax=Branchiostoma belcheri TaxID=7741 RepID=A0A6P4Z1J9_BRABE|nr:PREDICTED: group XIIA secretory phospholipase A2-like [Branchiostoma belcheri]